MNKIFLVNSRINSLRGNFRNIGGLFNCQIRYEHEDVGDKNYFKGSKYKIFRDEDAPIILDVEEERNLQTKQKEKVFQVTDEFKGLNLLRGETGVFEVEDLLELLKLDNAKDICVIRLPPELKYVEYMVIVTCKSRRHIIGLAEFARKVFKKKCNNSDTIPKIEGENCSQWCALDLGNIILHIMSSEARIKYDLESLWAVGQEYDTTLNESEDQLLQLLKKHSISLEDLQPANR